MSFNELNSVEHFIIKKLSGKCPQFPPPHGGAHGFWFVPVDLSGAEELNRPTLI